MPTPHTPTRPHTPQLILFFLVLAALACTIPLGGPAAPPDSAAPSPEALESFNNKWLNLQETISNGQFTLTFTQEEVAAAIDSALTNADTTPGTDIPLHDARVALEDGIVLYAQTNGGLFRASGLMTLRPGVDAEGQLTVQVESAEFGQASLDDTVLDQIAVVVADSLTGPTESLPVTVVLTGVSVTDDELTMNGDIIE